VQKTITGENLEDLFGSKTWRDHFTALSDILGFTLSIYTQTGKPIFISPGAAPLCQEFRSSSPNFASRCESVCRSFIMSVLATGKPKIFKCHAKIMCFALPVEYMHEKAAILGQGSFSSYDDFRDGMNLLNAYGIDRVTIKTPLIFTNPQQTWKSCRFTASTVSRLLKNTQENITLRMKFEPEEHHRNVECSRW